MARLNTESLPVKRGLSHSVPMRSKSLEALASNHRTARIRSEYSSFGRTDTMKLLISVQSLRSENGRGEKLPGRTLLGMRYNRYFCGSATHSARFQVNTVLNGRCF